jgi:hypothetical protein
MRPFLRINRVSAFVWYVASNSVRLYSDNGRRANLRCTKNDAVQRQSHAQNVNAGNDLAIGNAIDIDARDTGEPPRLFGS